MKKTAFFLVAIAAAFVACSKENPVDIETPSKQETVVNDKGYELFAKVEDLTKAAIAEANGAFTWSVGENGDEIAVKTSTNNVYKFKAAEIVNDCARFICSDAVEGDPLSAVYPYTADATCTLPTEISSLNGALDASAIRLTGTIAGKNITFQHANALLKVSFTNVPTFASKVKFVSTTSDYEQEVLVSGISLTEKGTVEAYIPVKAGTYGFTVSLIDSANNTMISRSTNSDKTFAVGALINMKGIALGTLVMMSNTGNSYGGFSNMKVYNWWDGGSHNVTDELSKIAIGSTVYGYYFLPADLNEGKEMHIKVEDGTNTSKSTETVVYNLRDFIFTIKPNNGGIATKYRTYFKVTNSNWDIAAGANIKDIYVSPTEFTMMTLVDGYTKFWYYEWPESYYGYGMHIIMQNSSDTAWLEPSSDSWQYTLNREYIYIKD